MKKKIILFGFLFVVVIFMGYMVLGFLSLNDISRSHIQGNVPSGVDFDSFLKRDLLKYFVDNFDSQITNVQYEMLRSGPTQSGVAYPKYYAWVKIFKNENLFEEGVVRMAAIEKESFDVTDYMSSVQVKSEPEKNYTIFPEDVVEKIKLKISK